MTINEENNRIIHIEAQIAAKKDLLANNYKKMKEEVKTNKYLVDVLHDYDKYIHSVLDEQEKERKAFELLDKHISSLLEEPLTKDDISFLKKEKSRIINKK